MHFQCINPTHRCRIVWSAKQPILKIQSGTIELTPYCPKCNSDEYVSKFEKVVK